MAFSQPSCHIPLKHFTHCLCFISWLVFFNYSASNGVDQLDFQTALADYGLAITILVVVVKLLRYFAGISTVYLPRLVILIFANISNLVENKRVSNRMYLVSNIMLLVSNRMYLVYNIMFLVSKRMYLVPERKKVSIKHQAQISRNANLTSTGNKYLQ